LITEEERVRINAKQEGDACQGAEAAEAFARAKAAKATIEIESRSLLSSSAVPTTRGVGLATTLSCKWKIAWMCSKFSIPNSSTLCDPQSTWF
jgi:hypothetical protein